MKDANKANRKFCFHSDGIVTNSDIDFYWGYDAMEISLEENTIDHWGDDRNIGGLNAYNMATGSVTISQAQSVAEMLESYLRSLSVKGHTLDSCWEKYNEWEEYNDCDDEDDDDEEEYDDLPDVVLSVICASIWKDYLEAAITVLLEHGFYDDDEEDDDEDY